MDEQLIFITFRIKGLKMLAFKNGNDDFVVIDEHGGYYGTWSSVYNFKRSQDKTKIGMAKLSFLPY